VFNTPRFTLLYRRWLKQGNAAFEAVSSPVFAEALANGTGRVDCLVLPHTYRHLSPLVSHSRAAPPGIETVGQDLGDVSSRENTVAKYGGPEKVLTVG
jgi:hypothetical protein